MRALVLTSFDGPSAVRLGEVADAVPDEEGVAVAVQAAGVGAWDVQTTQGAFAGAGGMTTFPQVLGWDFTGTVSAVGARVHDLAVGAAVLGFSPQPWAMAGTFAESIVVPAAGLARRPAGLSVEQAAVLPVSALTADLAVRAAGLGASGSVLVLGAAGGVGSLVVQLARAAGATVLASVSGAQAPAATGYGAALVVDRDQPVAEQVLAGHGQVDAVIDLVGPAARAGVAAAIKDGGQFVTTVPYGESPDERGIGVTTLQVMPDAARLTALAEMAAAGQLRATIGAVVPFADAPHALDRVGSGAVSGKVVLDLR
jgi:NADPH:quinone reductase-like Zn-dependent oxidoreductase